MTLRDEKYVVFKRDEWEQYFRTQGASILVAVEDAVVIRRQDVFAPPALDAYANSISVAVEALQGREGVDTALIAKLLKVADYFHSQAQTAWITERKLPD